MAEPLFWMWYDDNPKLASAKKVEEAVSVYTERFRVRPNLLLINTDEVLEYPGMNVRGVSTIARNNYWLAYEKPDDNHEINHEIAEGSESHEREGAKATKRATARANRKAMAAVSTVMAAEVPAAPTPDIQSLETTKVRRTASTRKRASAA
jgi:hypothetical protein